MRFRCTTLTLIALLGGCTQTSDPPRYSVFFPSYSADLDSQARQTVQEATRYAQDHSWLPVVVAGYAAAVDPKRDDDTLPGKRAEVVKQAMVDGGIRSDRITTVANGLIDPKPLPSLAVRRVDISFGSQQPTKSAVAGPGFK